MGSGGCARTGPLGAVAVHPVARALALSVGPAVGIGLARFGYAVLLPAMQADLGWSYTEAGAMNTANSFGYLAGALVTAPVVRSFGVAASFRASILVAAGSMALSGLTTHFWLLLALRTAAGIAGAVALIAGATLAARLVGTVGESSSGLVLGTYFGGVGVGILAMGLGLPVLLEGTPQYWAPTWIGMGVVGLLVYPVARRESLGLTGMPAPRGGEGTEPFMRAALTPSLASYFLFGLGYITYMTFVIAFLGERAWGPWGMSAFWVLLGASTLASGFVWPRLFAGAGPGRALAIRLSALTVGAAVPLFSTGPVGVAVSAVLFGGSFLSVVSVITDILRRALDERAWSAGIALFTVAFSVGQTLGPVVSGAVADLTGTLSSGFALSAVVLAVSAALAALQGEVAQVGEGARV